MCCRLRTADFLVTPPSGDAWPRASTVYGPGQATTYPAPCRRAGILMMRTAWRIAGCMGMPKSSTASYSNSRNILPASTGKSSKRLGQKHPAAARRQARHLTKPHPPLLLVKRRCLKTEGIQHRAQATPAPGFVFEGLQQLAAQARAAQGIGQVKQVEEGHAQRGFAGDAAEDLPSARIPDQHRQWLAVVGTGDGFIERGETVAEQALGVGVGLVADFNLGVRHRVGFLALQRLDTIPWGRLFHGVVWGGVTGFNFLGTRIALPLWVSAQ